MYIHIYMYICLYMYVCTYIYVYRERELHALTEQNTGHEHNRCKWLTQESAHSHSFKRRLPCLNTALGINKFTADCSLGTLPLWIFQHHNRSNDHHWGQRTLHCIDSLERFGRISAVKLLDLAVAMLSPHKKSWQPAGPYTESRGSHGLPLFLLIYILCITQQVYIWGFQPFIFPCWNI